MHHWTLSVVQPQPISLGWILLGLLLNHLSSRLSHHYSQPQNQRIMLPLQTQMVTQTTPDNIPRPAFQDPMVAATMNIASNSQLTPYRKSPLPFTTQPHQPGQTEQVIHSLDQTNTLPRQYNYYLQDPALGMLVDGILSLPDNLLVRRHGLLLQAPLPTQQDLRTQ